MNDLTDICQLAWFNNVNTYNYRDKHIVLYDDHRNILNVIFESTKLNLFSEKVPNIIYFDHHDDACDTDVRLSKYGIDNILEMNSRDFWSLVEFDLSVQDDDWVTAGMELGLINDVVCIGSEVNHNINGWDNNVYKTKTNVEHKGFCINHLKREIGDRGALGDSMTEYHPEYNYIRNIFGYNNERFSPSYHPFILDFDLDCFTTECKETTYAWPEKIFWEEYGAYYPKCSSFMQQLIARASLITVCREPKCCGGLGESNKILGYLDRYLFDGALGTEPVQ